MLPGPDGLARGAQRLGGVEGGGGSWFSLKVGCLLLKPPYASASKGGPKTGWFPFDFPLNINYNKFHQFEKRLSEQIGCHFDRRSCWQGMQGVPLVSSFSHVHGRHYALVCFMFVLFSVFCVLSFLVPVSGGLAQHPVKKGVPWF